MIKANDPSLVSWVEVKQGSDFPIQNLPLGVFKTEQLEPRVGMRIGEFVIDMKSLQVLGYLDNLPFAPNAFDSSSLNLLMKKGKLASRRLRDRVSDLLEKDNTELQNNEHHVNQVLIPIEQTIMLMPVEIGDYTDFIQVRNMQPMWVPCFVTPIMHYYLIGYGFLLGIMDDHHLS